jgi:hypothetical protein
MHIDLLRRNLQLLTFSGRLGFGLNSSINCQLLLLLYGCRDLWCYLKGSEHNTSSLRGERRRGLDGSSGRRADIPGPGGEAHSRGWLSWACLRQGRGR